MSLSITIKIARRWLPPIIQQKVKVTRNRKENPPKTIQIESIFHLPIFIFYSQCILHYFPVNFHALNSRKVIVSHHTSDDGKQSARRAIKNFLGVQMLHGRLFKKAPWPPEASTIAMGSGMLFFVRCLITIWKLDCTDIHFMFSAWDCTTPKKCSL